MEEKPKRSRQPNFTKEETDQLVNLVATRFRILENRKTNGVNAEVKVAAWENLTEVFNATTPGVKRTATSLISNYKNWKKKAKKEHSSAKMVAEDSSVRQQKTVELIEAVQVVGNDWAAVAEYTAESAEFCKQEFNMLASQAKKEERHLKNCMKQTGGGPAPSHDEGKDRILEKINALIAPQLDGMFTKYDGDFLIMTDFQNSLPEDQRAVPVEERRIPIVEMVASTSKDTEPSDEVILTPKPPSKMKALKGTKGRSATKESARRRPVLLKSVAETYTELAEEKQDAVKLRKQRLEMQLEHDDYMRKKQKEIIDIELEIKKKELELINMKIEKETAINK